MIIKEAVSVIMKTGSVIITTVLSFVVKPPIISAAHPVITWQNVFIFISGIFSIFFYNWIKNKAKSKTLGFWLAGILVLLLINYEIMVTRFSVGYYSESVIVSDAPVKSEVKPKYDFWFSHKDLNNKDPYTNLVHAYQGSSVNIWNYQDLYERYYGVLLLYFLIIITVTIILVFISDLIVKK